MGGKASLILVMGFLSIFGYILFNMSRLTTSAVENLVGYNEIAISRNMASAGANIGLAILSYKPYPHKNRSISAKSYTSGPLAGSGYRVWIDSLDTPRPHLCLTSVSYCTTYLFWDEARTKPYVISDTVIIRFDYDKNCSFASFGWMSQHEGNVFFTTGDSLWGKVHSNSNIHIDRKPVFHGRVTTSHLINPRRNKGIFLGGKETGVPEIEFPSDLSSLQADANNATVGLDAAHTNTRIVELYVELKPGSSATNDGYAIISTSKFMGDGGTLVDSIKFSDYVDNVIYSTEDIHIKGALDGRLSIASGDDVFIEGNTTYENYPDAYNEDPGLHMDPPVLSLTQNQTDDMLGIVGTDDVIIPTGRGDITIHGAIFAKDGSFTAEDWNCGHPEGRINLIGSICQYQRGAIGLTSGSGYKKSYRFDPRFDEKFSENKNMHPPSFPSYPQAGTLTMNNWWESPRLPLDVKKFY